jgi:hypothetical protein
MLPPTSDAAGHRVLDEAAMSAQYRVRSQQRLHLWFVFLLVWIVTSAYAAVVLRWGWVPRDDGFLAHAAERVLSGEIPHRDFQDVYVGLLSYVHAGAFRVWGTNLASLRYPLFLAFVLFVPAVFWISSRMFGRVAAAVTTVIAAVWSIPNYSASMPSWYNLFFAVFGLAAICGYIEGESPWLLLVAGISAGISCLFKITGLYFVAAVLLFLVWRARPSPSDRSGRARVDRVLGIVAVLLFLASVVVLLRSRMGIGEFYHFLLPQLAIAAILLWFMLKSGSVVGESSPVTTLLQSVMPFVLGVLIPLSAFELAFARMGAARDLLNGVFLLPMRRLAVVGRGPAPLISLVPMGLVLALVIAATKFRGRRLWFANVVLVIGFSVLLVFSGRSPGAFTFSWFIFAAVIPAIVIIAAFALRRSSGNFAQDQRLMLFASTVAVCSLIQYPFSTAAYFCYVAPLVVLLLAQLLAIYPIPRSTLAIVCAFALLFPVFRLRPLMERDGFSHANLIPLQLPRAGGLKIRADEARDYEQLVRMISQHVPAGSYIYVAPDDAQVYFLTGMRNPTRITYTSLDEPHGQTQRILERLAARDVHLVVIDTALISSAPPELVARLTLLFPQSGSAGRFQVRWRE